MNISISNKNLKKIINVNSYLKNNNKNNYERIIFYIKKEIDDRIINKIIDEIIEEKYERKIHTEIIVTKTGAVQLLHKRYDIIKKQNKNKNKQEVDKKYIESIDSSTFEPTPRSKSILPKKSNIKNNSYNNHPIFSEHLRPSNNHPIFSEHLRPYNEWVNE